jgi:hypothetical protein
MSKRKWPPSMRMELREIGEALKENFYCYREGIEERSTHREDHQACWHCWGRHLIAVSKRSNKSPGK